MIAFYIRIFIILLIILIIKIFLPKKKIVKKNLAMFCIILLMLFILNFFPEKYFLHFNKIETAVHYATMYSKNLTTYDNKDFGFALDRESGLVLYLPKENGKYNFPERLRTGQYVKTKPYKIHVDINLVTKKTFILVENNESLLDTDADIAKSLNIPLEELISKQLSINGENEVEDSLGNKYTKVIINDKVYYYWLLDNKPSDYSVTINGQDFKLY